MVNKAGYLFSWSTTATYNWSHCYWVFMDRFEKVELLSAGHCASFECYVISRDCVCYAFCVESLHVFVDGFIQSSIG